MITLIEHPSQDVRVAYAAHLDGTPHKYLTRSQQAWYLAIQTMSTGETTWQNSSPSERGSARIRRTCRLAVYLCRHSDNPEQVLIAGRFLAEAANRKHPVFLENRKWCWQYLGTYDPHPDQVQFGFTAGQPLNRTRVHSRMNLAALLPSKSLKELDGAVKRELDFMAVPGAHESFYTTIEEVVKLYMRHRQP